VAIMAKYEKEERETSISGQEFPRKKDKRGGRMKLKLKAACTYRENY
jgi:hypothetical protein